MKIKTLALLLILAVSPTAGALNLEALPHFHRNNLPIKPDEAMLATTCEELDEAITYLIPDTYQYKPDFYDDKYNGAAVWASTIDTLSIGEIAWMYLPYSWFMGYQEESRQHKAFYQIEKLRRAKAIKQCYVH